MGAGGVRGDRVCGECAGAAGAGADRRLCTATTPTLWSYAANDSFFAPPIAAALYAAYTQNGGRAEFHQLGPFANDGHTLFFGRGGSSVWGPLMERYIASRPAQ